MFDVVLLLSFESTIKPIAINCFKLYTLLSIFSLSSFVLLGQDTTGVNSILSSPDKLFNGLKKKTASLEAKLDKQTTKYLSRLEKQESKIRKKLWKKDSTLAKELFNSIEEKYSRLNKAPDLMSNYTSVYSGHLDSLSTSLNFLKGHNLTSNPRLQETLNKYSSLQQKLNQADWVNKYLSERQRLLKVQFEKLGMVKELTKFQKGAYYYQVQIREYKELIENPSTLEVKLLEAVQKFPQFKEFFARNSLLGTLFPMPGSGAATSVSFAVLQTRTMINQTLISRFGSGANATQMVQQNMQAAQAKLDALKDKATHHGSGSYDNSSDVDMPEGFKPKAVKTKTFIQRLEYGVNIQTGKGSSYFPITTDVGFNLGYKLSDNSLAGVGLSYKMGWGKSWDKIRITHQGVGLRSFVDLKLKGSLYVSGGYEQNYRTEIHSIQQLKDYSAWQSGGLLGLSKKYKLKGKMKGDVKLLWDFLSYRQVPKTQAVVFRIGYTL